MLDLAETSAQGQKNGMVVVIAAIGARLDVEVFQPQRFEVTG